MPQGVKANTGLGAGKGNYTGPSNVGQGQFQNFNNSSQFSNASNSNQSGTMNLNNSSSAAYRANQIPPGSLNPQPKNLQLTATKGMIGMNVMTGMTGMTGMTSPTSLQNQSRPNVPVYTANNANFHQPPQMGMNQPGMSQNQWRKH